MRELKADLARELAHRASAVLLDPEYGVGLDTGAAGLIFALEATGSVLRDGVRDNLLLDGWTVEKVKRAGASGVKLVIHVDPRHQVSARRSVDFASTIAEQCCRYDLLFLAEPIVPMDSDGDGRLVLAALERMANVRADVFKIQYPGDDLVKYVSDVIYQPWALLTGGASFKDFQRNLSTACQAGCSGFVAGRAVWQEIGELSSAADRRRYMQSTVRTRFDQLISIVRSNAVDIWEKIRVDDRLAEGWYHVYPGFDLGDQP
jgi:tagatose 1,6-diphosphate aldolase